MKKNNNWIVAAAIVIGLAVLMLLSDRPTKVKEGSDVIRTAQDYQKSNQKATELVLAVFEKADQGIDITSDEKKKLEDAAKEFESMRAFDPKQVAANFGAGKCYMLLGDLEKARERLEQAYLNKDIDSQKSEKAVQLTAIEAAGLLSEVLTEMGLIAATNAADSERSNDAASAEVLKKSAADYRNRALAFANVAIENEPNGVRYLAARGNAYLNLGQEELARKDITKAFQLDPTEPRVRLLASLMGIKK